jgi:hypothetical protein
MTPDTRLFTVLLLTGCWLSSAVFAQETPPPAEPETNLIDERIGCFLIDVAVPLDEGGRPRQPRTINDFFERSPEYRKD